jgi:hypothetical protein
MSRSAKELALRQEYPTIDAYGSVNEDTGQPNIEGANFNAPYGTDNYRTPAFGTYHKDTEEKENLRAFYETLRAVDRNETLGAGERGRTHVRRTAPISDHEINVVRAAKEEQKQKKWEQYWWAQTDPGRPWTMTEVAKVDPGLVERKMDALKSISQFALDNAIIQHIGHGGDPRLAQLQYMVDQGMMEHMPHLLHVTRKQYKRGPLSLFNIVDPGGKSTDRDGDGKYDDQKLFLARSAYMAPGQGTGFENVYDKPHILNSDAVPAVGTVAATRRAIGSSLSQALL